MNKQVDSLLMDDGWMDQLHTQVEVSFHCFDTSHIDERSESVVGIHLRWRAESGARNPHVPGYYHSVRSFVGDYRAVGRPTVSVIRQGQAEIVRTRSVDPDSHILC